MTTVKQLTQLVNATYGEGKASRPRLRAPAPLPTQVLSEPEPSALDLSEEAAPNSATTKAVEATNAVPIDNVTEALLEEKDGSATPITARRRVDSNTGNSDNAATDTTQTTDPESAIALNSDSIGELTSTQPTEPQHGWSVEAQPQADVTSPLASLQWVQQQGGVQRSGEAADKEVSLAPAEQTNAAGQKQTTQTLQELPEAAPSRQDSLADPIAPAQPAQATVHVGSVEITVMPPQKQEPVHAATPKRRATQAKQTTSTGALLRRSGTGRL